MSRADNLQGKRFGKLTVLRRASNSKSGMTRWECRCECGNYTTVHSADLKRKDEKQRTKSCGCLKFKQNGKAKQNGVYSRLYAIYYSILDRCTNSKSRSFCRYGGRGITVCDEWANSYLCFYEWAVSHGYCDGLSIDRIDNDRGYSPENCRWADAYTQAANKGLRMDNKTGYRGVARSGERFKARVWSKGRALWHGTFDTASEASMARDKFIADNKLPVELMNDKSAY